MSVSKPYQELDILIGMLEKDEEQYGETIKPIHDRKVLVNHPELIPFHVQFGGYSGVLSFYHDRLEEINEQLKGTKLQRIIRILKEK